MRISQTPGEAYAVTMTIADDTLHLSWEEQAGVNPTQIRWLSIDLREGTPDES